MVKNTYLHVLTSIKSHNMQRVQKLFWLQPAHSYFVWISKTNLLLGYIYNIICRIFRINQRQNSFYAQQKFQHRDSDLDQFSVPSKILTSEF
jgi:hypothetical protein